MVWNNKRLEKFCRSAIGAPVRAVQVAVEDIHCAAAAHTSYPVLFYSTVNLPRSIVWHECGHLARQLATGRRIEMTEDGRSVLSNTFTDADARTLLHQSRGAAIDLVEEEREAQVWAVCQARQRGLAHDLTELLSDIDQWHLGWLFEQHPNELSVYERAKRLVLLDLRRLGVITGQDDVLEPGDECPACLVSTPCHCAPYRFTTGT